MILVIALFMCAFYANAEYRVYQYVVSNRVEIADQPKSSVVLSTMDPVSYQAYNGGSSIVAVDLLRTWICPGHTGKKDICPSPYSQLPAEFL